MKKDISKYVGQQIKHYRKQNRLTQKELGLRLGVKHNTISSYENGTNEPDQDILFALAEIFSISINDFFPDLENNNYNNTSFDFEYDFIPVPVSAGIPLNIDGMKVNDVEKIKVPDFIMGRYAKRRDIWIMKINGDSMNKVIPHGSLIAVKSSNIDDLKDNDIVVFSNGYEYSTKRFFNDKINERIIFRPDSTELCFTDYTIPYKNANELKIHGKVVTYIVNLD
ncbi:XRE family transcriptional regulator [Lysinibacillus sp. UGB7]|uniref:helix-turn-helix domain-containing protein n=1 Tax=Lysinibacillus sp. UGB7 TaxID=3411039 RepID=UPI003B8219D8